MSSGMSSQVSSGGRAGVVSIVTSCAPDEAEAEEGPSLGFSGLSVGGLGGGAEDMVRAGGEVGWGRCARRSRLSRMRVRVAVTDGHASVSHVCHRRTRSPM